MGDRIVAGLDMGSSSVKVAIVRVDEKDAREVLAVGYAPAHGIRRGMVVNIESTLRSIEQAISQAEQIAECEASSVVASLGGLHIEGINSKGVAAVSNTSGEVTAQDVHRVIDAAKAVSLPADREMLHVLPRVYSLDGQKQILNPVHMMGVRLEAEVHLITASLMAGHSMVQSINRAGFHVQEVVYGSYAASKTILSQEEKKLGVLIVTLGADTSEVLLFKDGAPYLTEVLPLGARHITADIAAVLKTSLEEAERIKIRYGIADTHLIDHEEEILIQGVANRSPRLCSNVELCEIIEARMVEIFQMIYDQITQKGIQFDIPGGVVLNGGGALLTGSVDLAESIFKLPTRIGSSARCGGLVETYQNPLMSIAVGLTHFSADEGVKQNETKKTIFHQFRQWTRNFFE